jgi:hypothetical protein
MKKSNLLVLVFALCLALLPGISFADHNNNNNGCNQPVYASTQSIAIEGGAAVTAGVIEDYTVTAIDAFDWEYNKIGCSQNGGMTQTHVLDLQKFTGSQVGSSANGSCVLSQTGNGYSDGDVCGAGAFASNSNGLIGAGMIDGSLGQHSINGIATGVIGSYSTSSTVVVGGSIH